MQIGKSWGKLTSSERLKYDKLACNAVASSASPSCADSWGDSHVTNWRKHRVQDISCKSSHIQCFANELQDQYCAITNAQIDFSQYTTSPATAGTGAGNKSKRKFEKRFLSTDCAGTSTAGQWGYKMDYLFSPVLSARQCDVMLNGTTLLYSHDNIANFAHTYNDILNVWLLLYLESLHPTHVRFLTIDAMKLYNNFNDHINEFYSIYSKSFQSVVRGLDYGKKVVCFERLILQSLPSRGFVWDNWQTDLPCSYVGPSSLYQRYNLHLRQSFGLLRSG